MQSHSVVPGQSVEPGQEIGQEGGVGAGGISHAHTQVFRGADPTALNPLRHLYEYHNPGQPIPPLPQFWPESLPTKHQGRRKDPADDQIFNPAGQPSTNQSPMMRPVLPSTRDPTVSVPQQRTPGMPVDGQHLNPQASWDQRELPAPDSPAYIPEYLRYLQNADQVPRARPKDVRILRKVSAGESDRSVFNSGDRVAMPAIPPDPSIPSSPQNDFEGRYRTWPSPSAGGVLAGVNQALQGQPDRPSNEDWSAMWRRRTGLP